MVDAVKLLRQARRQAAAARLHQSARAHRSAAAHAIDATNRGLADSLAPHIPWMVAKSCASGRTRAARSPVATAPRVGTARSRSLPLCQAVVTTTTRSPPRPTGAASRVLELGSGCGLVALALACRGANVVATERAIALPLLEKNVAANAALVERRGGTLSCAALDWTTPDADVLNRGYDAVVGADLAL